MSRRRRHIMDFEEEDNKSDETGSPTSALSKIVPYVGVPTFILNTFGPQLMRLAKRYPRLFKILIPIAIGLSTIAATTQLVWPLCKQFVGDYLPFVQLKSNDPLYTHLMRYVHYCKHPLRHREIDARSATIRRQHSRNALWWPTDHTGDKDICYEKSGTRLFWHNGTLFVVDSIAWAGDGSSRREGGTAVKLKAIAFSHAPIKRLLHEAWTKYQDDEGLRNTTIYHATEYEWDPLVDKNVRPLDTVDLDEADKSKLMKDVTTYLSDDTKTWYNHRGIPYRRGYMFYGPPGTGKTSLSMAIAGHFSIDLYIMSLASPKMSDEILARLMTQLETPCVLLLEDIDSVGLTREITSSVEEEPSFMVDDGGQMPQDFGRPYDRNQRCSVTLSGVLNALDGAASPEGHILIMSTNKPEALDPALVRAGRVDCKVEFKNASRESTKRIFKRMIGQRDDLDLEQLATDFADKIPEYQFSPAELQGYLLNHIGDVDAAMEGLEAWVKKTLLEQDKGQDVKDVKQDEKHMPQETKKEHESDIQEVPKEEEKTQEDMLEGHLSDQGEFSPLQVETDSEDE